MLQLSKHAQERLDRVRGIISMKDLEAAAYEAEQFIGETGVLVKRLPSVKRVTSPDGGYSEGDCVWVVYRRADKSDQGCITTVELRHKWQGKSPRWSRVIKLVK